LGIASILTGALSALVFDWNNAAALVVFDGRARLSFAPSAAPPCPASAYLARGFFLGSREAWPLSRVFLENLSFFTLKRSRTAIPTADGRSCSCRQMASRGCLSRLNWASGLTHQRQPTIIGIASESMISPCRHRRAADTQSAPSATPSLGVASSLGARFGVLSPRLPSLQTGSNSVLGIVEAPVALEPQRKSDRVGKVAGISGR
jgi:hypothetical protein